MNGHLPSVDEIRSIIEQFIAASGDPVLIEPGEDPLELRSGSWLLEQRAGRLTLQAWDDSRNLSRRLSDVEKASHGRVELITERFGKRPGSLVLMDRRSVQNQPRLVRASRLSFQERFRRALRRQFTGWTIGELTSGPDLEHSLSPSYPRAFITRGTTGWAAIAAPPDAADPGGVVTFGLIWLDYLRKREPRLTVEGLAVFLPGGLERIACLRLSHLNSAAAQIAVYLYSASEMGTGAEDRVDLSDYGNLDTKLTGATRPSPAQNLSLRELVDEIMREVPEVERVDRNDGGISLRVRGLEFARCTDTQVIYGIDSHRRAESAAEVVAVAAQLARLRDPSAANTLNPLYTRNPEGWLESQIRAQLTDIDARLLTRPVYGQVPAFTAGDRDVIDMLAADRSGRLNVIEVKAKEDIHLPVQALDYWMRVNWHATQSEFAAAGYFPGIELRAVAPRLMLVSPALDFHPANQTVLRYFAPEIDVHRIGVGMDWRRELKVMFRY